MTGDTDRVLASIDEAIDGYVSEDWTVGDDAMRWRPEEAEPSQTGRAYWAPAGTLEAGPDMWTDLGYATEHMIVQPSDDGGVSIRPWDGMGATVEAWIRTELNFELMPFQRELLNLYYGASLGEQAYDISSRNWEPTEEVEPHWDDSLVASMDRTRQGEPEPAVLFGPSPVVVARTTEAIEEALRSHTKPELEPLTVNWKVDAGRVSGKHRNRR